MTLRIPLLIALVSSSSLHAAPPKVNAFFPAGGQRGTTVSVAVDGEFSRWPVDAFVEGKGVAAKPGKERGTLLVTIAADALPGTYGIRMFDAEGAALARPFFVSALPEVLEREPNDDQAKPQALGKSSVIVNGRLAKMGDVDTFAVPLKKGQTLVASLEASHTLRSPMDAHLQVASADGFVLEHSDDFRGLDPQVAFAVPKDGTYLVRTFAFPAKPDSSIRFAGGDKFIYRLTLTTGPFFDFAYPLAVARAAPGKVDMIGWNIPPALRMIAVPPPGDIDTVRVAHPESPSVVQVRLEPHPVLARTVPTSRKAPQKIALPVTITGRLDKAGDVDVYQFEGKKGQKPSFRIAALSLGFPLDPVLQVLDQDGKALARAQGASLGKEPALDFTVPSDAPLLVEVSDLYGMGGPRHVYRLQAVLPRPDFNVKLAAERFTMTAGKTLDLSVTIERVFGYSKNIDLSVEGLPAGVTTAAGSDKAKGKTLTLKLNGGTAPFSGPIRVLAKTQGDEAVTRVGQANVAELGTVTENLWLTIVK